MDIGVITGEESQKIAASIINTDPKVIERARLLIGGLRQDAYDDHPLSVSNQGFVPQLVVRGSTAPAPLQARPRPPSSSEA